MAKWLKVAGLAVVALLVAASASGDSNTYNYQGAGPYFNPKSGNKVTATGDVTTSEASKDRDYVVSYDNIIADTTATYMADSSAVYPTGDANRLYLYVRVTGFTGGAAALPWTKLGIRVRSHLGGTSDSLNTYPWDPSPFVGAGVDSTIYGAIVAPTTAVVATQEIQVVLTAEGAAASKWAEPHTYVIPLKDNTGVWYWGEYTSIKYRVIGASNTPLTYTVSLRGRP